MATIKDVAEKACVSIATVSRILNKKGKYSEETESRVHKAAEELGYTPNLTAKSLKTGLTGTIGIAIKEYFLLHYPVLLHKAIKVLTQQNYSVEIILNAKMKDCVNLLNRGQFDGLLIACIDNDEHALRSLIKSRRNFVFLGGSIEREDVNMIEIDYFQGGYIATQHLINLGHDNILFIEDNENLFFTQEIKRGYLFALDESGIQYKENLIVYGDHTYSEPGEFTGYNSVRRLISKRQPAKQVAFTKPFRSLEDKANRNNHQQSGWLRNGREADFSAVLTTDDKIAYGALKALKDGGLRVPADKSIIGFGNLSSSEYLSPPLTTVEIPLSQMGELGAEILVNNIKRRDSIIKRVKLKIRLAQRETLSKRLT